MKALPFVSIIIVNLNGRNHLSLCLRSLEELNYPQEKYEVIVVDNNSNDDSVPFIEKKYPLVKIIQSEENLGFAGGNNLGITQSKGEYVVLLNSDTRVDPLWLRELVKVAADPKIGIVNSLLRFWYPTIRLQIISNAVPRSRLDGSTDHSPIGVLIEEIVCKDEKLQPYVYYLSGFYNKQPGELVTRRSDGEAVVLFPVDPDRSNAECTITLHGFETKESTKLQVQILADGIELGSYTLAPHESRQVRLKIPLQKESHDYRWLVQNAGNIVLTSGYSKDRGSCLTLRDNEMVEYYEPESDYYHAPRSLQAACGAACLIKRTVIDKMGMLDGSFFMYYEDIEYSLRAVRAGWKIAYAPKAIVYHKHRATTGSSETPFFLSLVERNHLRLLFLHFPLTTCVVQLCLFLLRVVVSTVKAFVFQFRDNISRTRTWSIKHQGRNEALRSFLATLPKLLYTRIRMDMLWPRRGKLYSDLEKTFF